MTTSLEPVCCFMWEVNRTVMALALWELLAAAQHEARRRGAERGVRVSCPPEYQRHATSPANVVVYVEVDPE